MALDAEGATRMFTIYINGAASKIEAIKAARAVADYDLVKCAISRRRPELGQNHLRSRKLRRETEYE